MRKLLLLSALLAGSVLPAAAAELRKGEVSVTPVFDHPLPTVPGKSLRGVLVAYGPGGASPRPTPMRARPSSPRR